MAVLHKLYVADAGEPSGGGGPGGGEGGGLWLGRSPAGRQQSTQQRRSRPSTLAHSFAVGDCSLSSAWGEAGGGGVGGADILSYLTQGVSDTAFRTMGKFAERQWVLLYDRCGFSHCRYREWAVLVIPDTETDHLSY